MTIVPLGVSNEELERDPSLYAQVMQAISDGAPGGGGGSGICPFLMRVLREAHGRGHEDGLESQLVRYARAGHLRNWQWDRRRRRLWYDGQLEVAEVLREARRVAASSAGLVHTRDAGL